MVRFGAATSQHNRLDHDDTHYLLALAFADQAFWGIDSPEDLWQLQIPPDDNELVLRWRESAKYLPILRNATKTKGVTKEPLPRKTLERIVKSALTTSGFFGEATIHVIRRYLGKQVHGKSHVMNRLLCILMNLERYTEVELSQHITQRDRRTYGRDYTANTSSVDGRSAFFNEPAQHDHVNYFQSFRKFHENGLPTSLPASKQDEIRQDSHLLKLEDEVRRLQGLGAANSHIQKAQNKVRSYRDSLMNRTLKKYKLEWVQQRRDWKIATRGKQRPDDNEKNDMLGILSQIMPERGRLARIMVSGRVISNEERRQVIEDLFSLASQGYTTIYLPGESPINGVCPARGCDVTMQRFNLGTLDRSCFMLMIFLIIKTCFLSKLCSDQEN